MNNDKVQQEIAYLPFFYQAWATFVLEACEPEYQTLETLLEIRENELDSADDSRDMEALEEWIDAIRQAIQKRIIATGG